MKIIFGLGNKDAIFDNTPHNCGFLVVDKLAEKYGAKFKKEKLKGVYAEIILKNEKVLLVKPQTYMNDSGQCVLKYVKKFKLPLSNILVVLDDIDIKEGDIRYRQNGSGGTHNGLKNIVFLLKTTDFPRLRVGVGKPPENIDLKDFVLSKLSGDKKQAIDAGIDKAIAKIEEIL